MIYAIIIFVLVILFGIYIDHQSNIICCIQLFEPVIDDGFKISPISIWARLKFRLSLFFYMRV